MMSPLIAIVTLSALIFYMVTLGAVGISRGKHGVHAPAMTGHPVVERAIRVQANTLEGLILFLPSLWAFAAYISEPGAAALGAVWIFGRIIYMAGYMRDPAKRGPGFGIQALATIALLLGGLGGAIWTLMHAA